MKNRLKRLGVALTRGSYIALSIGLLLAFIFAIIIGLLVLEHMVRYEYGRWIEWVIVFAAFAGIYFVKNPLAYLRDKGVSLLSCEQREIAHSEISLVEFVILGVIVTNTVLFVLRSSS